ncbi:MAG TPA: carbonic anhydrase family protein [Burkholderiaceae bacterium]|nr:carbonic anhydrase family protein [Burkholderiaceae bacterium]
MSALFSSIGRNAACLLALSIAASSAAQASEAAAAPMPAASAAGSDAAAAKTAKRAAPHEAIGPRDPMDVLRERLAQKLGAMRAPEGANPNVLRVVSKASAPSAPSAPTAHDAEPAAAAPKRVAGHRAAADPAHPAAHPPHWDYAGAGGPQGWGKMAPEYAKCSSGTRQSPIDIREGIRVELDPVQFDYKPSAFRVVDNGHTVQVNVAAGNAIEVMGRRYELVQFHFHRPSEERVDGKAFDMVVHLVHKDLEGRLAVVAVLLERGSAQPVVQAVWNNLPLEKGDELAARAPLDPNGLLPAERRYFTYMGSLTTPPCSEGVLWMVMKQPVAISAEQIGIFARLYPMNARPIQSAAGRLIKESN